MKSQLLTSLALALLLITGCKKNDNNPDKVYLLSQLTQTVVSGLVTTTFKYDDQNRLIEYYNDGSTQSDFKFTYDGSNRLVQEFESYYNPATIYNPVATLTNVQYTYTYPSANTINAVLVFKNNGVVSSTYNEVFTLNDKQQVIRLDYGTPQASISYYTYDASGNRVTQSDFFSGRVTPDYVFAYTFDQSKNPFLNIKGNVIPLALTPGINNIISEAQTQYSTTPNYVNNYLNTYQYNSDGYPTKRVQVQTTPNNPSVNSTSTITYSYIVK